jgi:glycosyltransferase involved in cell wall biosynthesis
LAEVPPVAQSQAHAGLRGKRAAVLLYSSYPSDPRPRRAAEAMIESGMTVDLLCLAGAKTDLPQENVRGVQVERVPLTHRRDSKLIYLWQYGRFFFSSLWFLSTRGIRHRYDVVHVHNMPDFLVFAALLPKLRGARVILDLHDPMPELMESIYGMDANDWKVRFLRRLERWSIGFSDLALTPNITFKNLFVARSCRAEKMQIVMNSPQQEIFYPAHYAAAGTSLDRSGVFHVMHHGSIVHRHGVDLLVEAVARLRPTIPGIRLDIYGNATPFLDTVLERAQQLGIADIVSYHGAKSQSEIAAAILKCDVGVVPNRRSAFIEINFPTRLFEYLAMGRPVVAPSTQGIRDYFNSEQIFLFEPNDVADLAAQIGRVKEHPAKTLDVVRAGGRVYQKHLWNDQKSQFVNLVSTLCLRPEELGRK